MHSTTRSDKQHVLCLTQPLKTVERTHRFLYENQSRYGNAIYSVNYGKHIDDTLWHNAWDSWGSSEDFLPKRLPRLQCKSKEWCNLVNFISELFCVPVKSTKHDYFFVEITVQIWRGYDVVLQGLCVLVWRFAICDLKQTLFQYIIKAHWYNVLSHLEMNTTYRYFLLQLE